MKHPWEFLKTLIAMAIAGVVMGVHLQRIGYDDTILPTKTTKTTNTAAGKAADGGPQAPQTTNTSAKTEGYLMFLKEKRCGKIKGRGWADGRKQRVYKTKEETSSPTVTTEALFFSCVIDALEGRDVATVAIPGAFMQVDMDEEVHVRFSGPMATLLAKVDPSHYNKYITYEKGRPIYFRPHLARWPMEASTSELPLSRSLSGSY